MHCMCWHLKSMQIFYSIHAEAGACNRRELLSQIIKKEKENNLTHCQKENRFITNWHAEQLRSGILSLKILASCGFAQSYLHINDSLQSSALSRISWELVTPMELRGRDPVKASLTAHHL